MATADQIARENIINSRNAMMQNTANIAANNQLQTADIINNITKLGVGSYNAYVDDKMKEFEESETDEVKNGYLYDYDDNGNAVPVSDLETVKKRADDYAIQWAEQNGGMAKGMLKTILKNKNKRKENQYGQMLQSASYNYNLSKLENVKNSYDGNWEFDPLDRLDYLVTKYEEISKGSTEKYNDRINEITELAYGYLSDDDKSNDKNANVLIAELDMMMTKDMLQMSDSWYAKYRSDSNLDAYFAMSYGVYADVNDPFEGYKNSVLNNDTNTYEVALADYLANIEAKLRKDPITKGNGEPYHLSEDEINAYMTKVKAEIKAIDSEWGKVVDSSVKKIEEGLATVFDGTDPFDNEQLSSVSSLDDLANMCLGYTKAENGESTMSVAELKNTQWWKTNLPVFKEFVKYNNLYTTSEKLRGFNSTHTMADYEKLEEKGMSYEDWVAGELNDIVNSVSEEGGYILQLMGFGDIKDTNDDNIIPVTRNSYGTHFMAGIQKAITGTTSVDLFERQVSQGANAQLWKHYKGMQDITTLKGFDDYITNNNIDIVNDPNSSYFMSVWKNLSEQDKSSKAKIAYSDASYAVSHYVSETLGGDYSKLTETQMDELIKDYKDKMDPATYEAFKNDVLTAIDSATLTSEQEEAYDTATFNLGNYVSTELKGDYALLSDDKIDEIVDAQTNLSEVQKRKLKNSYKLQATNARIEKSNNSQMKKANEALAKYVDTTYYGDYSQLSETQINNILGWFSLTDADKETLKTNYSLKASSARADNNMFKVISTLSAEVSEARRNGKPMTDDEILSRGTALGVNTQNIYSFIDNNRSAVQAEQDNLASASASEALKEFAIKNPHAQKGEYEAVIKDSGVTNPVTKAQLLAPYIDDAERSRLAQKALEVLEPLLTKKEDSAIDPVEVMKAVTEYDWGDDEIVGDFLIEYLGAGQPTMFTESNKAQQEDSIISLAESFFGSDSQSGFNSYIKSQEALNEKLNIENQYYTNKTFYVIGSMMEDTETYPIEYIVAQIPLSDGTEGKTEDERLDWIVDTYFSDYGEEDKSSVKEIVRGLNEAQVQTYIANETDYLARATSESKAFLLDNGSQHVTRDNGDNGATIKQVHDAELEATKKLFGTKAVHSDKRIHVGQASSIYPNLGTEDCWDADETFQAGPNGELYAQLARQILSPSENTDEESLRRLIEENFHNLTEKAYDSLMGMLSNSPQKIIDGIAVERGDGILDNYNFSEGIKRNGIGDVEAYQKFYQFFIENSDYFSELVTTAAKDQIDPVGKLREVEKMAWNMYYAHHALGGELEDDLNNGDFVYFDGLKERISEDDDTAAMASAWFAGYTKALSKKEAGVPSDVDTMLLRRHLSAPLKGKSLNLWDAVNGGTVPKDAMPLVGLALALCEVNQSDTYAFDIADLNDSKKKKNIETRLYSAMRQMEKESHESCAAIAHFAKFVTKSGERIQSLYDTNLDLGTITLNENGQIWSKKYGCALENQLGKLMLPMTIYAGESDENTIDVDVMSHANGIETKDFVPSLVSKSNTSFGGHVVTNEKDITKDDIYSVCMYNVAAQSIGQGVYLVPMNTGNPNTESWTMDYEWVLRSESEIRDMVKKNKWYGDFLNAGYLPFRL